MPIRLFRISTPVDPAPVIGDPVLAIARDDVAGRGGRAADRGAGALARSTPDWKFPAPLANCAVGLIRTDRLIPIVFPSMRLPVPAVIEMPLPKLPERALPAPAPVPPMTLRSAPGWGAGGGQADGDTILAVLDDRVAQDDIGVGRGRRRRADDAGMAAIRRPLLVLPLIVLPAPARCRRWCWPMRRRGPRRRPCSPRWCCPG